MQPAVVSHLDSNTWNRVDPGTDERKSMINKLLLGAFALTMVAGPAFADSTTGSTALDNKD